MFRNLSLTLAALSVVAVATALAEARRGGREDQGQGAQSAASVTSEQAVNVARGKGLTRLHEVKFDDGHWEVEGWTADGRRIEVDVHPATGEVLKLELYAARR